MKSFDFKLARICLIFLSLTFIGINPLPAQTILVDSGAEWKYLDDGSDQGTSWRDPSFDDAQWPAGAAQLGYGDGDEATVLSYGSDPDNKYITTYFRHSFYVNDPSQYPGLNLELLRDDGAVIYLNGIEIERSNMPADPITYLTPVSSSASGEEDTFFRSAENPVNLVAGTNVLAVEVHQESPSSSDISFDLRLSNSSETPDVMRKVPYLIYNGRNSEMQVLWQLTSSHTCTIEWGTDLQYATGNAQTTEYGDDHQHRHTLTGLIPDTRYYYRVSVNDKVYESFFRSAPAQDAKSVKFFVYGDTRSQPDAHDKVAAGILAASREDVDLQTIVLAVGDLVSEGDQESLWDEDFFSPLYPNIQGMLASLPYQSCMGNHERDGILYTKYFPYPFEAGRYWSFDYGPAHFVVVDQYTSYGPGSAQLAWIENDLASSPGAWNFIILHEPGWSAGTHGNESDVQNYIQPLCEQYNVHVVFSGHNHNYARAVVNNVQHITTGGGGAPLYDPDPSSPNIVTTTKAHHFCKVEIEGRHLSITAADTSGNIIDSFSIEDQSLAINLSIMPPDTLNFNEVYIGYRDTMEINLTNTGYGAVHITAISIAGEGFSTLTDTSSLGIGESLIIPVIFVPLAHQPYSALLSISSNDTDNPTAVVALLGEGVLSPEIVVTPDSLIQNLVTGDTAQQVLTISNLGSKDLVFDISAGGVDPPPLNVSWFFIDTLSGIVPPASKTDLAVTFDAGGLIKDSYASGLIIVSNDPHKPELNIPVQLIVSGFPDISIPDTLLIFVNVSLGVSLSDTLLVANKGTERLTINEISVNDPAFRTDTTSFDLLPGENYPLLITFTPDSSGVRLANLTITSNDPDEPNLVISLKGEVLTPPAISVSHAFLRDTLAAGQDFAEVIKLKNTGGSPLSFNISSFNSEKPMQFNDSAEEIFSELQSWLSVSPDSGKILAGDSLDIEITGNAGVLGTGDFEAEIVIFSNDPDNKEIHMPVYIYLIPTGIEDRFNPGLPKTYELYQNYPNPFNPVTHIQYGLPKTSNVKIEIYNIIGKSIKILIDKQLPAGYHQVEFNSRNLPSGIYFYRLEAGEFRDVKKMLLVK